MLPWPPNLLYTWIRDSITALRARLDRALTGLTDVFTAIGLIFWDGIISQMLSDWHEYVETNSYLSPERPMPMTSTFVRRPALLDHFNLDSYVYQKLPAKTPSTAPAFRLVELLPSLADSQNQFLEEIICCKILLVELRQEVEFEALSYTWGTAPADFPILILDRDEPADPSKQSIFHITPNLYAALKRLQLPKSPRILWIDQLCINQCKGEEELVQTCQRLVASSERIGGIWRREAERVLKSASSLLSAALMEKNDQVEIMRQIYQTAKRTIIWLGDDQNDGNVIQTLVNGNIRVPNSRERAINNLLSRDWFRRAWIYQEAVLSKDLHVVVGRLEIKMDNLLRLSKSFFTSILASNDEFSVTETRGMETLYLIEHGRGQCKDLHCWKASLMQKNLLAILVQVLRWFEASRAHDLIYAFLAFQPEDQHPKIRPRYDLPATEAWKDAARCIVESSNNLDIFACAPGVENEDGLPSWVPCWNHIFPYGRPICAPDFHSSFDTSAGRLHRPVTSDTETLIVRGTVIAQILWISSVEFGLKSDTNLREDVLKYTESRHIIEEDMRLLSGNGLTHPQLDNLLTSLDGILLRTLLADGAFGHTQPLPWPLEKIRQVLDEESAIRSRWEDRPVHTQTPEAREAREKIESDFKLLRDIRDWSLITQHKRLFVSDGFDLGLVAEVAEQGDSICMLDGSKVPCVLRECNGQIGQYRLISQCYLDGWMYRDGAQRRDASGDEAQVFELI